MDNTPPLRIFVPKLPIHLLGLAAPSYVDKRRGLYSVFIWAIPPGIGNFACVFIPPSLEGYVLPQVIVKSSRVGVAVVVLKPLDDHTNNPYTALIKVSVATTEGIAGITNGDVCAEYASMDTTASLTAANIFT